MNTPYTYLLIHKPSNKKYYGVRFAKDCSPNDLWVKYFSSSKEVHRLIESDGLDSFIVEVRKTFLTNDDAIAWEEKVLRRMNVLEKNDWLNLNIAGAIKQTTEVIAKAKLNNNRVYKKGFKHSEETRRKMSESRKGKVGPNKGKTMTAEQKAKISSKMKNRKVSDDTRIKLRESALRRKKLYNPDGTWNWVFS